VVVEELLQFLIGEVDAQLLKAVELPNVKKDATFSRFSHHHKAFPCIVLILHLCFREIKGLFPICFPRNSVGLYLHSEERKDF